MSSKCICSQLILLLVLLCMSSAWSLLHSAVEKNSLTDSFSELGDDADNGKELPFLIQRLMSLSQQRKGSNFEDSLSTSVNHRLELSRLLREISRSDDNELADVSDDSRRLDLLKRGIDDEVGAMPPRNEFCRMLKVRCG